MSRRLVFGIAAAFALAVFPGGASAQVSDASPVVVVETSRGAFSFATYPTEAPATVAHIVALVRKGFYDGQRFHRAIPGFLVQFGDPQSRDVSKRDVWGRGAAAASGQPIGVAEIVPKLKNTRGAVGVAHLGDPSKADSQIYITLTNQPDLDGRYAVFGRILDGEEVLGALQVGDVIVRVFVKE